MKLTKNQKTQLKHIKQTWGKEVGLKFITIRDTVTICWARVFKNSKMIAVSTSYYDVDETDRFRAKTGEYFSAMRLSDKGSQLMLLPLGHMLDCQIDSILINMFDI